MSGWENPALIVTNLGIYTLKSSREDEFDILGIGETGGTSTAGYEFPATDIS